MAPIAQKDVVTISARDHIWIDPKISGQFRIVWQPDEGTVGEIAAYYMDARNYVVYYQWRGKTFERYLRLEVTSSHASLTEIDQLPDYVVEDWEAGEA